MAMGAVSKWSGVMISLLVLLGLKKVEAAESLPSFFTLHASAIDGKPVDLSTYKDKVVLVVNVASKCGFTKQYKGLEELYQKYKDRGLVILGFPSNDFGGQEPGTNSDIKKFCSLNFGVTFPLFEKGPVTGKEIQPVFKFLTVDAGPSAGGPVLWNFEKFLIDRNGKLIDRFRSPTAPMDKKITGAIEKLL